MAESAKKYSVTDDEIANALSELEESGDSLPIPEEADPNEKPTAWSLKESGSEHVGLHIRNNQTYVVQVSKKNEFSSTTILRAGYEQPEKLATEMASLGEKMGRGTHYAVTLSGKHANYLVTKVPELNRAVLQRAFKIQMRALVAEEVDDVNFIKLPAEDYLVSYINPAILDRTVDLLKKARLRLVSWDTDILSYARAVSFLWKKNNVHSETAFAVVMGWNRCRLLIMGKNGRLVAPLLPMGVMSFSEHLSTTLGDPNVTANWLDPKRLVIAPNDSPDIRMKKVLANQAIFTLFVPFSQQIKMSLYKACSDFNIPLPKHFAVMGPGSNLFRITDSLEMDLNLKALHLPEGLEPEMAAAFGAALWDRNDLRVNHLPASGGELLERLKDLGGIAKEQLAKLIPQGSREAIAGAALGNFNPLKVLGFGGLVALLAISYPIWQRSSATRELASAKAQLEALGSKKEELLKFSERQNQFEKKLILKKLLEKHRSHVGDIMKEVLFNLPNTVRLTSLNFRDTSLLLKGVARTQTDLEAMLELYSKLEKVKEPEPLSIRRTENTVGFEVRLKVK